MTRLELLTQAIGSGGEHGGLARVSLVEVLSDCGRDGDALMVATSGLTDRYRATMQS